MTPCPAPITTLTFRGGEVEAFAWPEGVPPPFGARLVTASPRPPTLRAPGRLRWRLRRALEAAGAAFRDRIASPPACSAPKSEPPASRHSSLTPSVAAQATIDNLRLAGYRGLLHGVHEADRVAIAATLARALDQRALVAVLDSAAVDRWHRLAGTDAARLEVHTFARLGREMYWRGGQQDLLIADALEAAPHATAGAVCSGSAALARVGFLDRLDAAVVERLAAGFGPLLQMTETAPQQREHLELRVPLPDDRVERYEQAWHAFLAAYDRFLASRGSAGFGAFLSHARRDPTQRPAVVAWHEAVRLAAWHPGKAALLTGLLRRHEGDLVLVFTPDRQSAYEIAQTHLLPAVTSELPRAERQALLGAFAAGQLRVLAGPRLLETGVEQERADVAILVGGGHGIAQRERRLQRVRPRGRCYELTSLDTLEIGRASRWRAGYAHAAAAVHHG